MRQRLFDLIDEDQAEITCIEFFQRRVDGQEFTMNFADVTGAGGVLQPGLQERQHFAIGTPALALILIENDAVKGFAEDFGLLADVFVAAVSGTADDDGTVTVGPGG